MNTLKKCINCNFNKSLDFFYKSKTNGDGYRAKCKECFKEEHKRKKKTVPVMFGQKTCTSCKFIKDAICFNKRAASFDGLSSICKECKRSNDVSYYKENSEVIIKRACKWIKDNPDRFRKRVNEYQKRKESLDPLFKISRRIRARLYHALEGNFKKGSAIQSLGCTVDEFKKYIQNMFEPGMNWNNYGPLWHLDHIKPLHLFDLQDEKQFKEACHYTNYQPLWLIDNVKKGDTFSFQDKQSLETAQIYDFLKNELNQEVSIKENSLSITNKNIIINYCNLMLNGETKSGRYVQMENYEMFQRNNTRLITIFEDEWIHKKEQVKGFLKSIFNESRISIGARKCIIKKVEYNDVKDLLNANHLQGAIAGQYYYAIYYNNEIIASSVWGASNVSRNLNAKNDEIELIRYCVKNGIKVVGGLSKTISLFFKENPQFIKIISYSDNRWSVGNIYEKLGFIKTKKGEPSYWYFLSNTDGPREHRYTWRKQRAMEIFGTENFEDTEWDIMKRNGYDRIWDCGSSKWEYTK